MSKFRLSRDLREDLKVAQYRLQRLYTGGVADIHLLEKAERHVDLALEYVEEYIRRPEGER